MVFVPAQHLLLYTGRITSDKGAVWNSQHISILKVTTSMIESVQVALEQSTKHINLPLGAKSLSKSFFLD